MLHRTRIWGVAPCEDIHDLARKLTDQTWTLCAAFQTAGGTIWANDSTNENALQEYAVLRPEGRDWHQVETITVSWCKPAKLREYIRQADEGAFDQQTAFGSISGDRLERRHERCPLCA